MPAEQRTQNSGTIPPAAATLADQVEQAFLANRWPAIWTPQFAAACGLLGVALQVRIAVLPQLPALIQALAEVPGGKVSRVLTQLSTELHGALAFAGDHPIRRRAPAGGMIGVVYRGEILHLVYAALAFPAEEAARRVQRYALCWLAFQAVFWEFRYREARLGSGLKPAHYAMALAMNVVPEVHKRAVEALQRLAGLRRLTCEWGKSGETSLPDHALGLDQSRAHRVEVIRGEVNKALFALLAKLRDRGEHAIVGKLLDEAPELTHLPHAAEMDVRNELEKLRREGAIPEGGQVELVEIPPAPGTEEQEAHDEQGGQYEVTVAFGNDGELRPALTSEVHRSPEEFTPPITAAVDLRQWLANPPPSLLKRLTPTDRKILDEYRKAVLGKTRPLESERDLAARSGCSPAAVVAFLKKVQENSQGG